MESLWQTIYDTIFILQNEMNMNKLKFSIVKISRRDMFCFLLFGTFWNYLVFFGICLSDFLHTFAKAISLMRSSYLFGNNYFGNFELGVLIVFVLFY